jgi:hypothetical protein
MGRRRGRRWGEGEERPVERIRQEWIREGVEFEINGGVFCRVA